MSKFHQGPADGHSLMLARAPRFLRVVVGPNNKIDALDQLGDSPEENEEIHVYEIQTEPIRVHINRGRGKSGWYQIADYAHFPEQPADHEVRTHGAWEAWVQATAARLDS
jgi:hypothetical protein